ncbi:MAG TPA: hypothetical protein VIQ54_07465 [Polyangia bacterium]
MPRSMITTVRAGFPDSGMAAWLVAAALFVAPAVVGCGSTLERPTLDGGDATGETDSAGPDLPPGCPEGGVRAGNACATGTGCLQDPLDPGSGICSCASGSWHCSYSTCPTQFYWGIMSDGRECAFIDYPADCACTSQYNPNQGHSYCICMPSSGSDAGFD